MASTNKNKQFAAARAHKRKLKQRQAPSDVLPAASTSISNAAARVSTTPKKKTAKPLSALRWSKVKLPSTEIGFNDDGGMLELEEIDGVDVVYGDSGVTFEVAQDDLSEVEPEAEPDSTANSRSAKRRRVSDADETDWDAFKTEEELFSDNKDASNDAYDAAAEDATEQGINSQFELEQDGSVELADDSDDEDAVVGTLQDDVPVPEAWADLPLARPLHAALAELGFDKPTDIQKRVLRVELGENVPFNGIEVNDDVEEDVTDAPAASSSAEPYVSPFHEEELEVPDDDQDDDDTPRERDIVGVAQTGSGKTLAYGLPILTWVLSQPEPKANSRRQPAALVLAPTRELALQVRAALADVAYRTNPPLEGEPTPTKESAGKRQRGRYVNVVALTGGMSIEKQKRQLSKGADVIVATPGRLWDLIGDDDALAQDIKRIKFLVIDEADRMIENGHFAELDNIVKLTKRQRNTIDDEFKDDFDSKMTAPALDQIDVRPDMRTFVFSATMSKDLQRNLKKKRRFQQASADDLSSLDDLLMKLDFRDVDPEIIDLSPEGAVVDTLQECKVECLLADKDVYLYNFLLRYPGRTIVFLSAIDGIRRLFPLLTLLEFQVFQLHSGMQQRARLKALDRFKSCSNGILLATDVAARGLDVPSVEHVVHFQLPRSADMYVHRSGRTARAGNQGLALQIVAPEEKQTQRLLMAQLGRGGAGKKDDLIELPVDFGVLDQLRNRVELAKKVDQAEHRVAKDAHDRNWLKKTAEAMDVELEPGMLDSEDEEENRQPSRKKQKKNGGAEDGAVEGALTKKARRAQQYELRNMKAELKHLLSRPVAVRGISSKYLTTRNRVGFVDQLVSGTGHSAILGLESTTALSDAAKKRKKGSKK
ncbi:ATP-dependent RNA helicase [Microbotryomycetes sp. JL221]|nr:ATP-dependent RNA helicase [Microbotryomycetes sp. JL221]